nr:hypothetical protein [Tanacetum cinerariifolium]
VRGGSGGASPVQLRYAGRRACARYYRVEQPRVGTLLARLIADAARRRAGGARCSLSFYDFGQCRTIGGMVSAGATSRIRAGRRGAHAIFAARGPTQVFGAAVPSPASYAQWPSAGPGNLPPSAAQLPLGGDEHSQARGVGVGQGRPAHRSYYHGLDDSAGGGPDLYIIVCHAQLPQRGHHGHSYARRRPPARVPRAPAGCRRDYDVGRQPVAPARDVCRNRFSRRAAATLLRRARAGTSAGAMAMSQHMIRGGSVPDALLKGAVKMGVGLGLLPSAIIDSHFVKRGRFGRLIESVALHPKLIGIGLGEDTGVLITEGHLVETIGSNLVIIMDGHDIVHNNAAAAKKGMTLSIE